MNILVTDKLHPNGIAVLQKYATVDEKFGLPEAELVKLVPTYDALMVRSGTTVTHAIIEAGIHLKAIGRAGTGVDNVDVKAATEKGVLVVNAPGANAQAAAEMAVALLLAACRNVVTANNSLRAGKWERSLFTGIEISGKTIGLLGMGAVGKSVAVILKAFGALVLVHDPFLKKEQAQEMGVTRVDLDALYAQSDILSLHVPLNEKTRGMVSSQAFALMKDGVVLVNAARGGIVDENALLQALESGKVRAAGIDVFLKEPVAADSISAKLVAHARVVATPHLGASTTESQEKAAVMAAENLVAALQGKPVQAVNPNARKTQSIVKG
jgi:D-3-phosphoglycerate dehydrogenase / 2-oxoglutarate reductase